MEKKIKIKKLTPELIKTTWEFCKARTSECHHCPGRYVAVADGNSATCVASVYSYGTTHSPNLFNFWREEFNDRMVEHCYEGAGLDTLYLDLLKVKELSDEQNSKD